MTDNPAVRACPEVSILAQFAEGTLDARVRTSVATHVGGCSECAVVVAETAAFLSDMQEEEESDSETPAPRFTHTHRLALAAAAAIALACLTFFLWRARTPPDPLDDLRTAAASLDQRPVEGMLVGFEHRPYARRGSGSYVPSVEVFAAAERAAHADAHTRGVAALMVGEAASAVPYLARPLDASGFSDLAAAYIAVGNYAAAVSAADRALQLSPDLFPAHFNRAVALDLSRSADALRAYERARDFAPSRQWRDEVELRIQSLR